MDNGNTDRKRKITDDDDRVGYKVDVELRLSLPISSQTRRRPKPEQPHQKLDKDIPFLIDPQFNTVTCPTHPPPPPPRTPCRNPTQCPHGPCQSETVPPPFPWATDRRATVHSLRYLLSHGITVIEGQSQCRRCETSTVVTYEIIPKFQQVLSFIQMWNDWMHHRAPQEWKTPLYPACGACGQANAMRPVIADWECKINWLFMFLGQTLGQCTLKQLKFFCEHTGNHRTGAKDRVLYLTYLTICKQLDPEGFNLEVGYPSHRSQPRRLLG